MMVSDSSSRAIRCPAASKTIPAAAYSGWYRGPDAELEPPAGHQVQAGRLVRHDGRMPEVVRQHDGAQPQPGGHRGRGGQAAERRQLLAERARREMVPQQQHVDPAVLHLTREIEPRAAFSHRLAHDAESQPCHAQARYRSRPLRKGRASNAALRQPARPASSEP